MVLIYPIQRYFITISHTKVHEILLWNYIEYVDVEREFLSSRRVGATEEHLEPKMWRDLIIRHALESILIFILTFSLWKSTICRIKFTIHRLYY
jgi:hypothetical protein